MTLQIEPAATGRPRPGTRPGTELALRPPSTVDVIRAEPAAPDVTTARPAGPAVAVSTVGFLCMAAAVAAIKHTDDLHSPRGIALFALAFAAALLFVGAADVAHRARTGGTR